MKICFLFSERGRKKEIGRESKEKDKKKNGDKAALLPSKLWIHCPSLETAAKG